MKSILLLVAFSFSVVAQTGLDIERRGSIAFITWKQDLTALEALTQLCNAASLRMKVAPAALATLQSEVLDLHLRGVLLGDCAQSIAAACGLVAGVQDGVLEVSTAQGDRSEALRRAAVEWYGRAALANPRAGRDDDTALRAAQLEYDGGIFESALAGFRVFAEGHAGSPLCAQAWLMAGRSAFRMERWEEARAALERVDEVNSDAPTSAEAALLTARSYLAQSRAAEALPRLRRAAERGSLRTSALARLLEAELLLHDGDFAGALDLLERTARRLDRAEPDITQRIPLWSGRVLLALNQSAAAVTQLQTALLTCPGKADRDLAALGLIEATHAAGDHVAALLAARTFLSMNPEGATLRRGLLCIARLQGELGLADAAVASWERLLSECPEGEPLAVTAILGLAQTLATERRWDEARSVFGALALRGDVGQQAQFEMARCDAALGAWERCLSALERVTDPQFAPTARALRARALSALGRHREAGETLGGKDIR